MTFSEARAIHLDALDNDLQRLKKVVSSPKWCNTMFKGFVEARKAVDERIGAIERLNDAEQTVRMKGAE